MLHSLAGRAIERLHIVTGPRPTQVAVEELAEILGGDERARRYVQAMIDRERRQARPTADRQSIPLQGQEIQ